MATSVYSLWLEPPPALASTSAGFITRYAGASGGRCPTFDPHVTIAGGFVGTEAQAKEKSAAIVASLASAFGPLRCDAMEVSAGTRFHQCVYLRMVPTEQLANAHALAARAFGLEPGNGGGAPYMPHLSLVYGQLTDAQREDARRDGETLRRAADVLKESLEETLRATKTLVSRHRKRKSEKSRGDDDAYRDGTSGDARDDDGATTGTSTGTTGTTKQKEKKPYTLSASNVLRVAEQAAAAARRAVAEREETGSTPPRRRRKG